MDIEESIVDNFSSEEEEDLEAPEGNPRDPLAIKKEDFENEKIIHLLQSKNILKKVMLFTKCCGKMELVHSNESIDKIIWRCIGSSPKHDVKIGIKKGSIYEDIKVSMNILYYLTYSCFLKNMSIRKSKIEINRFSDVMNQKKPTLKSIIKIFRIFRNIIKKYYHNIWKHNYLGVEPTEDGKARV